MIQLRGRPSFVDRIELVNKNYSNHEQVREADEKVNHETTFVNLPSSSVDLEVTTWSKDSHALYDY